MFVSILINRCYVESGGIMKEHKGSRFAHITRAHPCFNEKMHDKVGRAHVPVAPKCNIFCNFCTRDINNEEDRPGVAGCIMKPDDAIAHVNDVTADGPISVVGVAGPGDSLANEETFEFFEKLAKEQPDLIKCMSTNGLLLPKYADRLAELGVNSVTVTINAIDPAIAENIYSFIKYEGKVYNEIRLYKIESVKKAQPAGNPAGTVAQPQAAPAPQYQQTTEAQEDPDDLPF